MNIKTILAGFIAAMASAAAVSFAHAQQVYPVQQAPVYSQAPAPYSYPPNGAPPDYRRGPPNFDALEDDEAESAALPPPGPARCLRVRSSRPTIPATPMRFRTVPSQAAR